MKKDLLLLIVGVLCLFDVALSQDSISSGNARLLMQHKDYGYAISWSYNGSFFSTYDNDHPVSLVIDSVSYNVYYTTVKKQSQSFICEGIIKTKNGSQLVINDIYAASADNKGFELDRNVTVKKADTNDHWFNSYFGIQNNKTEKLKDIEVFVPGIWYKDNNYLPRNALAADYNSQYFYFREDRLPLPLVMYRNKTDGNTVSLVHEASVPASFFEESGLDRITDERMQFGTLGLEQRNNIVMLFQFPGCEGDRTYVSRYSYKQPNSIIPRSSNAWALRSHPLQEGVKHHYKLSVCFSKDAGFPEALNKSWEHAYNLYNPPIHYENMEKVYKEENKLLNDYWRNIGGAPGWPFSVYLPSGNVRAYDYQMGFIGFQIPNAYYLLRNGLEMKDQNQISKACKVIDFWAQQAPMQDGLPKSWAEPYIDKPYGWRKYSSYMRIAGDGMEGVLQAWSIMQKNNIDKPEWLQFCKGFGDWLVKNQNEDGSYYLKYDWWDNSKQSHDSKYTTTNVIRYMVELYTVTHKKEYLDAALKAGVFSLNFIDKDYLYVGGVIDNPNVKDRESGQQAIYAFTALYDVTQDRKWLDGALQAAKYTETYMYAYNIPMTIGDTLTDFPIHKSTTGQTLIATGHSGVDNGLSFSSFQYYRLYLFTGDKHLLQIAKMAMYNSLQTMDMDGRMGYKYKALQTEAFSLSGNTRGSSVRQWLAWNTAAVMDPLCRFKDAFNSTDMEALEKLPMEQRNRMNQNYGKTFGLSQTTNR